GSAVRSEVADVPSAVDKQELAVCPVRYVQEQARPVDDLSAGPVCSNDLLGIPVERVHTQRDSIVKDSEAAAYDRRISAAGRPARAHSGRDVPVVGYPLTVPPDSHIHRQVRLDDPMVLGKECGLKVVAVEGAPADEFDFL